MLLKKSADFSAKTHTGNTAQDMARKYGHDEIAQLLLDNEFIAASKSGDINQVKHIQDLSIPSPRIQEFQTSNKAPSLGQHLHMLMLPTIFLYGFTQNNNILP